MADINIPNVNKKSEKYIFKKNLSLRRKSKWRLITESAFMVIFSILLAYINYLIPNKSSLLRNLPTAINKLFSLIIDLGFILYEIFLVVFIFISLIVSLLLLIGALNRLIKIISRKTRKIRYK